VSEVELHYIFMLGFPSCQTNTSVTSPPARSSALHHNAVGFTVSLQNIHTARPKFYALLPKKPLEARK
jgi:hypothetical protein